MPRLTGNVVVLDATTGTPTLLRKGSELPEWAIGLVGSHALDGPAPSSRTTTRTDGIPPKGGPGSGRDAWAAYAAEHKVDVPADATREDIVAALDAAGVPTE